MDYEHRARMDKARVLAQWCRDEGLTAEAVIAMNDATRRQACSDAFVNLASERTWTIVVALLGATEREMHPSMRAMLPDDPWEGLPS